MTHHKDGPTNPTDPLSPTTIVSREFLQQLNDDRRRLAEELAEAHAEIGRLLGVPTDPEPGGDLEFYILDARAIEGNCAVLWGQDGKGYTCNAAKAGLYTRAAAFSHRTTDVPVHRDALRRATEVHVRIDRLREHLSGRLVIGRNGGMLNSRGELIDWRKLLPVEAKHGSGTVKL